MDRDVSFQPGDISEADATAIFSASTIAMVLTNPRLPDNPIVYVNRAFERLTGYTSEMALAGTSGSCRGRRHRPPRCPNCAAALRTARKSRWF